MSFRFGLIIALFLPLVAVMVAGKYMGKQSEKTPRAVATVDQEKEFRDSKSASNHRWAGLSAAVVKRLNTAVSSNGWLDEKSFKHFQAAADKGDVIAQYVLALAYSDGEIVAQDEQRAVYWFRQAAGRGYSNAQVMLANAHRHGRGTDQDDALSVLWYQRAAALGHPEGQLQTGLAYMKGTRLPKDLKKGMEYLRLSAMQNHSSALLLLGVAYYTGEGATIDHAQARELFLKAALRGNALAQLQLALMLQSGEGGKPDPVEAYFWSFVSRQQHPEATKTMESLREKLSAEQRLDVEFRATKWRPQGF